METENKCLNVPNKKLYYSIDNVEYVFKPILDKTKDNDKYDVEDFIYDKLPDFIHGKIFDNVIGYNPSGWWRYIYVKKKELIYK